MKPIRYFGIILFISSILLICVRSLTSYKLAKSANINEFYVSWTGKLAGQGQETFLKFEAFGASFENLPVRSSSGEVFFCSGYASIEFRSTYSIAAPCVIVDCSGYGGGIFPIYITENKKQLFYPISPGMGVDMSFNKLKSSSK